MTGKEIASYPEAKQVMKTFDHARNQSCATAPAQPLSYKKIICGETAIKIVETGMGHSDHREGQQVLPLVFCVYLSWTCVLATF